jgi:tRNA1Val (adenine37-N6)-methyltransferase
MIAQEYSNYSFKALELDPASAIQAKANVQLSPWEHKIEVIESDIRSYAPSEQFDIIISNPPFYQDELRSPDEKKNRAHHDQGLLLNELFDAIKKQLKPNGIFYLLLPYKRKREIKELFVKNGFTLEQEVNVRPAPHKEYFRLLLRGKNKNHSTGEISGEEITITREDGKYSDAFLSLLKSYYLYL